MNNKTWVEKIPHPSGFLKWLFKTPILLYRLGLGFIVGRLFMILTTTGRKSGLPRRTAIEFHEFKGRKYLFSGWGTKTDWFRNLEADPYITIQTWREAESVKARRLSSDSELAEAYEFAISNPMMRTVMHSIGFNLTLEQFLASRERFTFVTFDPVDHPTPRPLQSDLAWIWAVLLPPILFLSMLGIFQLCALKLGNTAGYLAGFAFYWPFWCLLLPWLVFRKRGGKNLLAGGHHLFARNNLPAVTLWIAITLIAAMMYGQEFLNAPVGLILLAIPLATVNGLCEEILWRGLYVRAFPGNPWLGIVYPAFGFALWHFAPQSLFPTENNLGFVLSTLFLGLAYGFLAYRTGSARWTAFSHSLNGIIALAAPLGQMIYSLIL